MSEKSSVTIEKVLNILLGVEAALDDIKINVEQKKQEIQAIARVSGEKAGYEAINELSSNMKEELDKISEAAEKEAEKILLKNKEDLIVLKKKMDERLQAAIDLVVKRVLGD